MVDVEQVVVRGRLTLAVLVTAGHDEGALVAAAHAAGAALGLHVDVLRRARRQRPRRHGPPARHPARPVRCARARVAAIAGRLAERGANIDRIRRLSREPVTTVELDVSGGRRPRAAPRARRRPRPPTASTSPSPPPASRRRGRRLVVMDVDSTLIQDEVIELLAAHAGRAAEVAAVTERAMRGELDFAASLHERVGAASPGCRSRCWTRCAPRCGSPRALAPCAARCAPRVHARARLRRLHRGRRAARRRARHPARARPTPSRSPTGCSRAGWWRPVVDRAGKAAALRRFAAAEGLPLARTVAIGDGANDLDMLAEAGLGIAFNAKPVVREQADAAVNVPYLDAVLYLLGIPRAEIEEADAADELPSLGPAGVP